MSNTPLSSNNSQPLCIVCNGHLHELLTQILGGQVLMLGFIDDKGYIQQLTQDKVGELAHLTSADEKVFWERAKRMILLEDAKEVVKFAWDNPNVTKKELKEVWVKRIAYLSRNQPNTPNNDKEIS